MSLAVFGQIRNADIAAGALVPEKRRGYKAHGRVTLVAGAATIANAAAAATDVVEDVSAAPTGAGARFLSAINAGVSWVLTSTAGAGDTSDVCYAAYDNTYLG